MLEEENLPEGSDLSARDIVDKYLRHWKWFLLSFIICVSIALYKLNFSRYKYEAIASIKIKDENSGDASTLSALEDLSIVNGPKEQVDDEIEILRSRSLITQTIKDLNLNVLFFSEKDKFSQALDDYLGLSTDFYKNEIYKESPIKINFFVNDSILHETEATFLVEIKSKQNYVFDDDANNIRKNHSFGEKVNTAFGEIIITPTDYLESFIGKNVLVTIAPIDALALQYSESLAIAPKSELSSILNLQVVDGNKKKAEDFLNTLVENYNNRAIALKEELTQSTSDFVNTRLEIISNELSNVDLTAESIKTRYRMSDVASEAGLNMESGRLLENQIVEANTELEKIKYLKSDIASNASNKTIPNIDVGDQNTAAFKEKYNELMLEKQRLLKNSTEKNPTVVNITEQLNSLKNSYVKSLDNLENTYKISLDALGQQSSKISSRIYSAPKQERQIRNIQRQQQIKESLYLYLLQKREETAITLGVSDPNAEIIDTAKASINAVSPKKKTAVLGASVLSLLLPIVFLYIADLLDSKVHNREDVEKYLKIPIIADIPKLNKSKERYLIRKDDYSPVAEAFRILRTNLSFILSQSEKSGKERLGNTIFITSTIAHEGKSLVSCNLATCLAQAGKKTILLGLDIRAPKIKPYLGISGKYGITNYVINHELSEKDITVSVPNVDNLDLISSGDIAPNPAELLMNDRISKLFDYARQNYDYVIVDTAAFSLVTDTLLLSKFADAFIYVIRTNYLDKRGLKYIKALHVDKRLKNMSLLVNGIDYDKLHAGSYGYGYGYGTLSEQQRKKSWWKKLRQQ